MLCTVPKNDISSFLPKHPLPVESENFTNNPPYLGNGARLDAS